jgi:hypothetical protein
MSTELAASLQRDLCTNDIKLIQQPDTCIFFGLNNMGPKDGTMGLTS